MIPEVDTVIDDLRPTFCLITLLTLNLKVFKTLCDMSIIQFYDINILNFRLLFIIQIYNGRCACIINLEFLNVKIKYLNDKRFINQRHVDNRVYYDEFTIYF